MKKIIACTVFIFLFFSYQGCADFSIRNIGKPLPDLYEYWLDDRHSELEIKKALLDCGYPNPYGNTSMTAWDISNEQDVIS